MPCPGSRRRWPSRRCRGHGWGAGGRAAGGRALGDDAVGKAQGGRQGLLHGGRGIATDQGVHIHDFGIGERAQQIEHVDTHGAQHVAAGAGRVGAPILPGTVGGVPLGPRQDDLAEGAGADQPCDLAMDRVVAELKAYAQVDAGLAAGLDHLAALAAVQRQRFSHQHMLARGGGHDLLQVAVVGGRDEHRIDRRIASIAASDP